MQALQHMPAPRIHLISTGVRKNRYAARTLRRKPKKDKRKRKFPKRKDDSDSSAASQEPQEPTHPLTPAEEKEAKKKEKEREEEEANMVTLENGERESRDLHRLRRLFFRLCFCRDLCECICANFGGIWWCFLIILGSLIILGILFITTLPIRTFHGWLNLLYKLTAPLRTVVGGIFKGVSAVLGWIG